MDAGETDKKHGGWTTPTIIGELLTSVPVRDTPAWIGIFGASCSVLALKLETEIVRIGRTTFVKGKTYALGAALVPVTVILPLAPLKIADGEESPAPALSPTCKVKVPPEPETGSMQVRSIAPIGTDGSKGTWGVEAARAVQVMP